MQLLPPIERPSLALFGIEPWRAAFELASHHIAPAEARAATGDGHPVVIFPGMGTDGTAVAPLRRYCRSLGYEALDWGRGFNRGPQGDIDAWLADLKAHTADRLKGFEQSATFIGWSLGGIYARELSKTMGRRVRQVITIGTPFNASADHTNVGRHRPAAITVQRPALQVLHRASHPARTGLTPRMRRSAAPDSSSVNVHIVMASPTAIASLFDIALAAGSDRPGRSRGPGLEPIGAAHRR